ncbi:MAG TPA: hypothetical protein VGO47_12800 [Chlamydiales bacterium]|jgi:hypothetical protein|nr:hypothetical protein [Chlamydiales bacterium]
MFGSGEPSLPLEVDVKGMHNEGDEESSQEGLQQDNVKVAKAVKGGMDEYEWVWKVCYSAKKIFKFLTV